VPFDTRNSCISTRKLASRNSKIAYLTENRRLCVLTSNSVRMVDIHSHATRIVWSRPRCRLLHGSSGAIGSRLDPVVPVSPPP
jgi:hypothetical protein